ncbi:MAG TPA: acyltransferase [Acidobacteriaceae bacterium]|nr:acyltransferase [Acidobacteriaceae bacterium]
METSQVESRQTAPIALRQNLERKTIPSLDGLRGISALSVALAHAWGLGRWIPADYAVVLFFEISGLLITWLLLSEQDRTGSIDRLNFMKRRTLRLFPAFYTLWLLTWLVPDTPGRWWAFFYMMDFHQALYDISGRDGVLGMAWSLGIEEKYYLIWPTVLKRFKRETLLKALLTLFFVVQVYHSIIYLRGHVMWAAWGFDTRVDSIILGSALAIAIKSGWLPPPALLRPWCLWASVALVMLLSGTVWVHRLSFGVLIAAYPLAIILMSVIARPPRVLNNRVASFFGRISYSLYLYNVLVTYFVSKIPLLNGFARVATSMIASILAATLSYYFIEKPFLRMKDRFHGAARPAPATT